MKMRVMIFIDDSNFFENIQCIKFERKQDRRIDYNKISQFVINYLSKNIQYNKEKLFHIRTYLYDGAYTQTLINKIKADISKASGIEKEKLNRLLVDTERRAEGQKKKFKRTDSHYFFDVRKKPLQFTRQKGIFQKGVDVQLAVDLVSNAYLNNYDVAVLFSGDVDLLESIRLIKTLGKQVIIFSHYKNMAVEMRKVADMYVNIQNLEDSQLDQFTHIFEKKENKDSN